MSGISEGGKGGEGGRGIDSGEMDARLGLAGAGEWTSKTVEARLDSEYESKTSEARLEEK